MVVGKMKISTATRNVCVNLNLFTRSEGTVSAMDTTGVRHSVCSDSSTHHNTGTQIQHLPHIKHTSLSPRSHRRPPNQPHYVNYEIITDTNKSSTSALGSELFVFGSALCAFGSALPGLGQNITPAPRISRRPEKGYD